MVRERGVILLTALIIVLTISLLGAALVALFFNVLTLSRLELNRVSALYLAEAGISKAINMLRNEAGIFSLKPGQIIPPTRLGDGYFEVDNDFQQSTIISIGQSGGVKRVLQLKYNAF